MGVEVGSAAAKSKVAISDWHCIHSNNCFSCEHNVVDQSLDKSGDTIEKA